MKIKYNEQDLVFVLTMAADFLQMEEWPDPEESKAMSAAFAEGERRLRRMANRLDNKIHAINMKESK